MPFRIIPERGQVSENSAKPSATLLSWATKQICDVLHDDEGRSNFASQSTDFRPKAASRAALDTSSQAGDGNVLAREAAGNDIDGNSINIESLRGKLSDVSIAGDVGPVLCKDTAGELLYFTEGDGLETARALKPQAETSDAGKEIEDFELAHPALRFSQPLWAA
nr:hypothetical protein [Sphingopyxis sp. 113P3]